jgi:drug/metabolite transporter (DMT)-like permease
MERINGETIAGAALTFLGVLFIIAAQINTIWTAAIPTALVLIAIGIALIALGRYTTIKSNRTHPHTEEHTQEHSRH